MSRDDFMYDRAYLRMGFGLSSPRMHAIIEPEQSVRSQAYESLGRLDVILMREWVAPGLPTMDEDKAAELGWQWVENAPCGPSPDGIAALERLQQQYGAPCVATGNAVPVSPDKVGLYVDSTALLTSERPTDGASDA